ncbi:hypothetical protein BZL41_06235 [Pseudomonas sp. PIC25]|nr:hypothetical protein BZL41_06235 [Pseudomonas sp. PIC25]
MRAVQPVIKRITHPGNSLFTQQDQILDILTERIIYGATHFIARTAKGRGGGHYYIAWVIHIVNSRVEAERNHCVGPQPTIQRVVLYAPSSCIERIIQTITYRGNVKYIIITRTIPKVINLHIIWQNSTRITIPSIYSTIFLLYYRLYIVINVIPYPSYTCILPFPSPNYIITVISNQYIIEFIPCCIQIKESSQGKIFDILG